MHRQACKAWLDVVMRTCRMREVSDQPGCQIDLQAFWGLCSNALSWLG